MREDQPRFTDLPAEVFNVLRNSFFDAEGRPLIYGLPDKRNTQDDPFDRYVHNLLLDQLPKGIGCQRAPGPLVSPDLVVMRPERCNKAPRMALATDLTCIVGIEVKKLERTKSGTIARSSGLDYNTTPPCGTVRVYDQSGRPLDIRGFYLFVCQAPAPGQRGRYALSAIVLCDGNLLNADFDLYTRIIGERTKEIGIGTYANGFNRNRPMVVFANPLSIPELDWQVTLIHPRDDLEREFPHLRRVGEIKRTASSQEVHTFYCYRLATDLSPDRPYFQLADPFPSPARSEKTQPRGRFIVNIELLD